METWIGALPGIAASLIVLLFLVKVLLNAYERLWKENNKKQANPEEMAYMIADAVNEALKRERDRERKRRPVVSVSDDELKENIKDRLEQKTGIPADQDEIELAFQQFRTLTGQNGEVG